MELKHDETVSLMEQDVTALKAELSKHGVFTTTFEELYNWGRKNSVWPLTFGLACCAIEMIATTMARYDLARFGAEVFRASPRQADLIIVSGTVTKKMAPQVVRLYNQMGEFGYSIALAVVLTVIVAVASTGQYLVLARNERAAS